MKVAQQQPDSSSIVWNSPFLSALDSSSREEISRICMRVELSAGDTLFREGDPADGFYLLESGSLEVLKHESTEAVDHRIAVLSPGEALGEMAMIDAAPRAATIRAIDHSIAYRIPVSRLGAPAMLDGALGRTLRASFAEVLAARLRGLNDVTVRHLRNQLAEANARAALGSLLITIIVLFAGFVFTVAMASRIVHTLSDTLLLNVPIMLTYAGALFYVLWNSSFPMRTYGLHLDHAARFALQAALWTVPPLLLIVAAKWALLHSDPALSGRALFEGPEKLRGDLLLTIASAVGYSLIAPVQEFITRSGIQSALAIHLAGRHARLKAYLIACLMFSFSHVHLAPVMVLMVTPLGLFWGWIFMRQNSLVGVSVSHIMVGVFSLYVVGFGAVIPS